MFYALIISLIEQTYVFKLYKIFERSRTEYLNLLSYSSILLILMTSLGCIFYVHSRTTGITGNFLYDVLVRCFFVARAWVFFFFTDYSARFRKNQFNEPNVRSAIRWRSKLIGRHVNSGERFIQVGQATWTGKQIWRGEISREQFLDARRTTQSLPGTSRIGGIWYWHCGLCLDVTCHVSRIAIENSAVR